MAMKLKLGTRGSALALAQARIVAGLLQAQAPGLEIETEIIKTSGDAFSAADKPLPKESLGKALFVKEIEEALLADKIDLAVHSSKDLPAQLPGGLEIAAFLEREDPRDVFIGAQGMTWKGLKAGMTVATSALRRREQILLAKPGVNIVPIRGNVDTRLKKLASGSMDGLVLAFAGLKRLGRVDVTHEILPVDVMVPSAAQGAIAVEARADRPEILKFLAPLDHEHTRLEVELERSLLHALGAGCATPLGCLARAQAKGLRMDIFYAPDSGAKPMRLSETCPSWAQRQTFVAGLAKQLLG